MSKLTTLFQNPLKLAVFFILNPAKQANMKHLINIRALSITLSRTCTLFVIVHQTLSSANSKRKRLAAYTVLHTIDGRN